MSNRKSTPGRIVTQIPVYQKRMTAFGEVEEHTGQFKEVRGISLEPRGDRKYSDREREIRKLLKPKAGSKKDTLGPIRREELKRELWRIINPEPEPSV